MVNFANLDIGHQIVFEINDKTKLDFKIENKSARFVVLDEINNNEVDINEKVIIPACTYEELILKDNTLLKSQIDSSFIPWNSSTFNMFKTDRFLDFKEIWLLSKTGKIRKYNETATIAGHFKLYKNKPSNYNSESFNNARKEVQKTVVKYGYQLLMNKEHISQIEIKWNLASDKIRKQNGKWKVDEIASAYIKNVDGISETDIISFKVLHQTDEKFTIIFNTVSDWKKPIYKIREVEKSNFTLNYAIVLDENATFPILNDINSDVINEFINWKKPELVTKIDEVQQKLLAVNNLFSIYFDANIEQNISEPWQWTINLKNIISQLPLLMQPYFSEEFLSVEMIEKKYQNKKYRDIALKLEITEQSKNNIKKPNKNSNNIKINFNIIAETKYHDMEYKVITPNINFKIVNSNNLILEDRLEEIKTKVTQIKTIIEDIDMKKARALNEITNLQLNLSKVLQIKKAQLREISNHTNLSVHQKNYQQVLKIMNNVNNINQQCKEYQTQINSLKSVTENDNFYCNLLTFINHYQTASSTMPHEFHKFIYFDKNFKYIIDTLWSEHYMTSFENYKSYNNTMIKIFRERIVAQEKIINQIQNTNFLKLNFLQKIKNYITKIFTFTNTKKAVNVIIDNNDLVFKKADAQLKNNINSAQFNQENKPSLLSPIIQTAPNWDKDMFGELITINNDNLLPQNSSVKTPTNPKTLLWKWFKSFVISDEISDGNDINTILRQDSGFNEIYDGNILLSSSDDSDTSSNSSFISISDAEKFDATNQFAHDEEAKINPTATILRQDSGFSESDLINSIDKISLIDDKNLVDINIAENNNGIIVKDISNDDVFDDTNPFKDDDDVFDDTNPFDNPDFVTNINNKLQTTPNKPFFNHNKNDNNLGVSLKSQ